MRAKLFSENVVDKLKILNKGFPMNLTRIEGRIATVEFFEGPEAIHKVVEIQIDRLENSNSV